MTRARVQDLLDLSRLGRAGRPPTPREIGAALPRGWVLEEDGKTARRDGRVLFREGWVLVLCLVCFGAAAAVIFAWGAPRSAGGWVRLIGAVTILAFAGGIAAPVLTRALSRRG